MTRTETDRDKSIKDFAESELQGHSFPLQTERYKKVVLKAAPGLDAQELAENLKDKDLKPAAVTELRGKNQNSHSYLIS